MTPLEELGVMYEITKAYKDFDEVDPKEFRSSHLRFMNPRSRTYVERGTLPQRAARPLAGGALGAFIGAAPGLLMKKPKALKGAAKGASEGQRRALALSELPGNPAVTRWGSTLGGAVGSSLGYSENIRSGNTRSFNRRTGKQAKSKFNIPQVGAFNVY